MLRRIVADPAVSDMRIDTRDDYCGTGVPSTVQTIPPSAWVPVVRDTESDFMDTSGFHPERDHVLAFEVSRADGGAAAAVRRCACAFGVELPTEYEYRTDASIADVPITLREDVVLRSTQETALARVLHNDRARSGVLVLPCGAGKTLLAIALMTRMRRPTLVLCSSGIAAAQWHTELRRWTHAGQRCEVLLYTSTTGLGSWFDTWFASTAPALIMVTTYSAVGYTGARSKHSSRTIERAMERSWGLVVLDEAHVVPAPTFHAAVGRIRAACTVALTATPVREDGAYDGAMLRLVGPCLFRANAEELREAGVIARVHRVLVRCPMPEALRAATPTDFQVGMRLASLNPVKLNECARIAAEHEARGDKVLVMGDRIDALLLIAERMGRSDWVVHGRIAAKERVARVARFRNALGARTLVMSRVGDTSVDVPDAAVLIEVSTQLGSRRQATQRVGRVSRTKADARAAWYYSLVSTDSVEMKFTEWRDTGAPGLGESGAVTEERDAAAGCTAEECTVALRVAKVRVDSATSEDSSDPDPATPESVTPVLACSTTVPDLEADPDASNKRCSPEAGKEPPAKTPRVQFPLFKVVSP